MATAKKKTNVTQMPAADPDAREKQLINLAVNLAEKQLRDGTAGPSVINHFLKLASRREVIEREILERQAQLITAKADAITSNKDAAETAKRAIDAMKNYSSSNG